MYVLVKDNRVFAGPNIWHPSLFESYIEDDYELIVSLPKTAPVSGTNLDNEIICYEVTNVEIPTYNAKIQKLEGPFYTFENNVAIQSFTVVDKTIDCVKSELFAELANNRWLQEISGTSIEIQNNTIILDTSRGVRDIYSTALQNNLDNQVWKLNTANGPIWLTLTLADLQTIVDSITAFVQATFAWEKTISDQISGATDLTSLDGVVITWPTN